MDHLLSEAAVIKFGAAVIKFGPFAIYDIETYEGRRVLCHK